MADGGPWDGMGLGGVGQNTPYIYFDNDTQYGALW